jgi:hypothetical protein
MMQAPMLRFSLLVCFAVAFAAAQASVARVPTGAKLKSKTLAPVDTEQPASAYVASSSKMPRLAELYMTFSDRDVSALLMLHITLAPALLAAAAMWLLVSALRSADTNSILVVGC